MKQSGNMMKYICVLIPIATILLYSCAADVSESDTNVSLADTSIHTQNDDSKITKTDTVSITGEVLNFDGKTITIKSADECYSFIVPDNHYEDSNDKLLDIGIVNNPFGIKVQADIVCSSDKKTALDFDIISLNGEMFEAYVKIKSIANNNVVFEHDGEELTGYIAAKNLYAANYTKEALNNNYSTEGFRFGKSNKIVLTQIIPYAGIVNGFETYSALDSVNKSYGAVVNDIGTEHITVTSNEDEKQVSIIPAIYEEEIANGDVIMISRLSKSIDDKTDELCEGDICGIEKQKELLGELLYISDYENELTLSIDCDGQQTKIKAQVLYDESGQKADTSKNDTGKKVYINSKDILYTDISSEKVYYVKKAYIVS